MPRTFPNALASLLLASVSLAPGATLIRLPNAHPDYLNRAKPLEVRVRDLFSRLTMDEKMDLLTGTAFTTRPIARLGLRPVAMADAGQGVRGGMDSTLGPATAFPSGVAMASTWDPSLVGRIGKAIGEEAKNKGTGVQVLLGPAVNIHRSPLGGRNGEYFSEDPYLASKLGVGYILGMQSTGVAACLKHYAANNEEVDRDFVNVHVSERALREIYLPAFEAGVKEGHAWTLMSSYNVVNGLHASANRYLLTDILKKCWGFDGMVMSDWGGVHETVRAVNAGNDLEMPGPGFLKKENILRAFKAGSISAQTIDANVIRILRAAIRVGAVDKPATPDHKIVNSAAHQHLAFEAAANGIVLLKNEHNTLPLNREKIHSIAVVGPVANKMQVGANGSPTVEPFYRIEPVDGIRKFARPGTKIRFARGIDPFQPIPSSSLTPASGQGTGLTGEYFSNRNLSGSPVAIRNDASIQFDWRNGPVEGIGHSNFSVRWTGKLTAPTSGRYRLVLQADDGCRLYLNGKLIIDHWTESGATPLRANADLVAGKSYDIKIEYFQAGGEASAKLDWTVPGTGRFTDAIQAAKTSDVAVVCVGTLGQEGEGTDRPSMDLPDDQDELIKAVASVNKRTIVVLNNGTPVTMTQWLTKVPALVETWFPGQEGGAALASVLFGDTNPSGKLPDTLAVRRADYPDFGNFPGVRGQVHYDEGIYIGYRHFDKKNIAPLFPFGHGLSYTTFKYGPIYAAISAKTGKATASLSITNTGRRAGAEVVQLYVQDLAPKVDKPVREPKAFQKVMLKPGETKQAHFDLSLRSFAYCDVAGKQWQADRGSYRLEAGSSSRDLRQSRVVRLTKTLTEPIPFLAQQEPSRVGHDLAYKHRVTASSTENRPDVSPDNLTDGDDQTRWSSDFSDPQWVAIDLGKTTQIARLVLKWEAAYASGYEIQTSNDNLNWSSVYRTEHGLGGEETVKIVPTSARWVRLYATKRATEFGVSLFGIEVYAPGK